MLPIDSSFDIVGRDLYISNVEARGSRDGFVETIVFNTALIRRRIRDQNLIFERRGNLGSRIFWL